MGSQVEEVIRRVVSEAAHVRLEEVRRDRSLVDFGLESMDVVEIVMAIQEECKVEIDRSALATLKTIGDFVDHVEKARAAAGR